MSGLRILCATIGALALAGCVSSIVAHQVVAPPNKSGITPMFADLDLFKHAPDAYADVWRVHVAQPPAEISVASLEPGDYAFAYDLKFDYPEGKVPAITRFNGYWRPVKDVVRYAEPSKGTVLLLHGYLQNKTSMAPWAIRLAQAGYRCAVVDLRGHGASTGKHISFGAFESRDIAAVIDDLGKRGWDVSRVGLFGVSYGASVALLTAGRDPRVKAVVAFEPFASAERAVPELARAVFTSEARGVTDKQFAAAHLKEAEIGGFEWKDADIPAALGRTLAPVLFLHGEADVWLSPDHSRELFRYAPPGSELKLIPRENHVSLPLQIEPFQQWVLDWFEAGLHAH